MVITINTPEGSIEKTANDFPVSVGPVHKGFEAKLSAPSIYLHSFTVGIEVSKNDGQWMPKANSKNGGDISYIIDF